MTNTAERTATCTCWCGSTEVVIPVEYISEGRTKTCTNTECYPGCPSREYDAFELEYPDAEQPLAPQTRKRIIVFDYDPVADSSPDTAALRPAYGGLLLHQSPTECECGCRGNRGKKTRFQPGHDAKLKGKLQRALAADAEVHLIGPDGSVHRTDPAAVAEHYGWSKIVEKGADRIRKRSSTPIAAEKRLAKLTQDGRPDATLVSFGRWDKTGRVMAAWKLVNGSTEIQYVTPEGTIETFVPKEDS